MKSCPPSHKEIGSATGYQGRRRTLARMRTGVGWPIRGALMALVVAVQFCLVSTAGAQTVTVTAQPSLYPGFDQAVSDYVTRCTGTPVNVDVTAGAGTQVDVDRQGPRTGTFSTSVAVTRGRAFEIVATEGVNTATYHVRCLPTNFPAWTFQRSALPAVEWFTAAPLGNPLVATGAVGYMAIFDRNGVPVWWMQSPEPITDFHPLDNGNVIRTYLTPRDEEHALDGTLKRVITAAGAANNNAEEHEALLLPNGNYLILVERTRPGFSFCGLSNRTIDDEGFQEVTPAGALVRQWYASDHIPLTEVPASWCNTASNGQGGVHDTYHVNSVEPAGNDFLLSFRHLDAIYRVSGTDGSIVWKLGGTPRAESLTILNDPEFAPGRSGFGGQHDARIHPDGSVSLFDNGYHPDATLTHPPRAVRYAIDMGARTATLLEQVTNPTPLTPALCCGSSRKLPGGNWLISFGIRNVITELTAAGAHVFSLSFPNGVFSYRSHPVMPGALSRAALRAGMDAQYPRGYVRPKSAVRLRVPLVPAMRECRSPNRTHGPPLAAGSCHPPIATSSVLTIGTPDNNGTPANASGSVHYKVDTGDPSTPASEADVMLEVTLADVRRTADLSDYTGQLQVRPAVRITDRTGGSQVLDTQFPATVDCTATASSAIGASCGLSTTFNAMVPGVVVESKRTNWEFGGIEVMDGGESGVAGASDARPFARQGIFVP